MQLPALVIDVHQCRSVDRLLLIDLKEIFMGKFLSGIFASVLAATFSIASVAPVNAAPIFVPKMQNVENVSSDVLQVRHGRRIIRSGHGQFRRHSGGQFRRHSGGHRYGNRHPGFRYGGNYARYKSHGNIYRHYRPGRGHYGNYGNHGNYGNYGNYGWYNGYRGYRYHHPGYSYYGGWWYPGSAFIAGAIIGGYTTYEGNYYGGDSHTAWCYNRYRSYREWDNTFQPYHGPRRQCISPFR
jgi:hypothetical protein